MTFLSYDKREFVPRGQVEVVTHVTFIKQGRICLSLQVSLESLHTVNSLLNITVMTRFCFGDIWVSRDSSKMTYWGRASINGKYACGMTTSCADARYGCNCDKNDREWREKTFAD